MLDMQLSVIGRVLDLLATAPVDEAHDNRLLAESKVGHIVPGSGTHSCVRACLSREC